MELQTKIPLTVAESQIDYQSRLLLLGSCFVQNMGRKLDYFKFQTVQNPFGILFHPLAIENLIFKSIRREEYTEMDVFFLNERWHCFDAHSDLSDTSKEKLLQKLSDRLALTNQQITESTHIIITLGTSWVYEHNKTGAIVANCHKIPQKEFIKKILSIAEIVRSLESTINRIRSVNKNVQFIFTISPIRHLKDGFTGNQRSKAYLIAAVHQVLENPPPATRISYFESFELMMDELRDYRFYDIDMIHLNQLAIDYIWEKFKLVWISQNAYPIMEEVASVQKGLAHRAFEPSSEKHQLFLKSLADKINYLQQRYAFMNF